MLINACKLTFYVVKLQFSLKIQSQKTNLNFQYLKKNYRYFNNCQKTLAIRKLIHIFVLLTFKYN